MSPSPEPKAASTESEEVHNQEETASKPAAEVEPSTPAQDSPGGDEAAEAEGDEKADEGDAEQDEDNAIETAEAPADAWQAVFSQEANAWYFWNAQTGETTWTNPRDAPSASAAEASSSASAVAGPSDAPAPAADPAAAEKEKDPNALPEIDPDLAWLDPSLAARKSGVPGAQAARFNARTGRFTADPGLNPDRISQFQRGQRQQEAYYDVTGWEQQLAGRGIKRAGEPEEGDEGKKRPSAKQVEKFRQQKEEKRRKKLNAWLA
ncbi:hypothetical protein JCM10450v2_005922 [Rhodotorula kratochvilovae]